MVACTVSEGEGAVSRSRPQENTAQRTTLRGDGLSPVFSPAKVSFTMRPVVARSCALATASTAQCFAIEQYPATIR